MTQTYHLPQSRSTGHSNRQTFQNRQYYHQQPQYQRSQQPYSGPLQTPHFQQQDNYTEQDGSARSANYSYQHVAQSQRSQQINEPFTHDMGSPYASAPHNTGYADFRRSNGHAQEYFNSSSFEHMEGQSIPTHNTAPKPNETKWNKRKRGWETSASTNDQSRKRRRTPGQGATKSQKDDLNAKEADLQAKEATLSLREIGMQAREYVLSQTEQRIADQNTTISLKESSLRTKEISLNLKESDLRKREEELQDRKERFEQETKPVAEQTQMFKDYATKVEASLTSNKAGRAITMLAEAADKLTEVTAAQAVGVVNDLALLSKRKAVEASGCALYEEHQKSFQTGSDTILNRIAEVRDFLQGNPCDPRTVHFQITAARRYISGLNEDHKQCFEARCLVFFTVLKDYYDLRAL